MAIEGALAKEARTPPIPVLMGPTGSGKTAAAVRLAREFPLTAIVADLRQIMRGMPIGSAQPAAGELAALPHKLCGAFDPARNITVEDWRRLALAAIHETLAENRIPLVLGGSGLAVKALVSRTDFDAPPAPVLRSELVKIHGESGLDALLEIADGFAGGLPAECERKNPHRVIRTVERLAWRRRADGVPGNLDGALLAAWTSQLDAWNEANAATDRIDAVAGRANGFGAGFEFQYRIFALLPEREWLAGRILARAKFMFLNGLLGEVRELLESGVPRDARALRGHGYPEALAVLDGEMSVKDAIEKTALVTRRYAKRQMTWLRHQFPDVAFLPVGASAPPETASLPVAEFLSENWAGYRAASKEAN